MSIRNSRPRSRLLAVGLCAAALLLAIPANAALIVSTTSTTAAPGDTGDFINVFLTNTGPSSVNVGGFLFKITVSSTDVTFTSTTISTVPAYIFAGNSLFGPTISTMGPGQTMDGSDLPNAGSTVVGAGASFGLGHVLFNVSPTATPQVATISFDKAGTSLSDPAGVALPIGTFSPGNITIRLAGTPEPATFGLMGFALAVAGLRLRLRKA